MEGDNKLEQLRQIGELLVLEVGIVGELMKKVGMEGRIYRELIQDTMNYAQFTMNKGRVEVIRSRRVRGSVEKGRIMKLRESYVLKSGDNTDWS